MKYFWCIGDSIVGPFSKSEVVGFYGHIPASVMICPETLPPGQADNWVPLSSVPELVNSWNPQDFSPAAPAPTGPPEKRKFRILATDDETFMRSLLWEILSVDGHELEFAADGEAAYAKVIARHYDLLILDVNMPKINGYKLSRMIAEKFGGKRPKILIYTARDIEKEKYQFVMSEADEILSKTASVKQIEDTIRKMLDFSSAGVTDTLNGVYAEQLSGKIQEKDTKSLFSPLSVAGRIFLPAGEGTHKEPPVDALEKNAKGGVEARDEKSAAEPAAHDAPLPVKQAAPSPAPAPAASAPVNIPSPPVAAPQGREAAPAPEEFPAALRSVREAAAREKASLRLLSLAVIFALVVELFLLFK